MVERDADAGSGEAGGSAPGRDAGGGPSPGERSGTPLTQQLGRVAVLVIVVLFAIFAVANAQFVDFSWIFSSTEVVETGGQRRSGGVPLIVLLLVSFVVGALVGGLLGWRRHRHRKPAAPAEPRS